MEIKDRLLIIMDQFQLSASQIADNLEIQRSAISHLLSGRNKPSINILEKIIAKYPSISIEWLITGIGNPIKNTEVVKNEPVINKSIISEIPFDDEEIKENATEEKDNLIESAKKDKTISKIVLIFDDNTFEILNK